MDYKVMLEESANLVCPHVHMCMPALFLQAWLHLLLSTKEHIAIDLKCHTPSILLLLLAYKIKFLIHQLYLAVCHQHNY